MKKWKRWKKNYQRLNAWWEQVNVSMVRRYDATQLQVENLERQLAERDKRIDELEKCKCLTCYHWNGNHCEIGINVRHVLYATGFGFIKEARDPDEFGCSEWETMLAAEERKCATCKWSSSVFLGCRLLTSDDARLCIESGFSRWKERES
jgi:hypothetical protein